MGVRLAGTRPRGGWGAGLGRITSDSLLRDSVAGVTGAALAVPEALGYAKLAGMPVVTGLYTVLLPLVVFALLASSRHLVVGADSATATILAAGLVGMAAPGSARYVQLAGVAAVLAASMLILARIVRLGFIAAFLSRTVLIGFLTGVGISVAIGQLPDMLAVSASGSGAVARLSSTVRHLAGTHLPTVAVAVAVVVVVLGLRRVWPRVPGTLVAVVLAIVASTVLHLSDHGVAVLGQLPKGLPSLSLPSVDAGDLGRLTGIAASLFLVILAQSAATARAYAARYGEPHDTQADLVGLGAANVAAAVTGTFVVNGSPTKTQTVDGAGGRSQVAQLVTAAVALVVVVALTGTLAQLPIAALAAVVFVIGCELVDARGMRTVLRLRPVEFAVALVTAASVVVLGVEQGVLIAVAASMVDHLRHSYRPRSTVLVKSAQGHWRASPVAAGARTVDGLVVYRFGSSLYFANAAALMDDLELLTGGLRAPRWLCLDCAAIGDVDFTAAQVLGRAHDALTVRGVRLVLSNVIPEVRAQLDEYGIAEMVGTTAFFDTSGEALSAFTGPDGDGTP